ncbi:MAG: PilZ domain-containing protein [Bdellovibrionales bacterium]
MNTTNSQYTEQNNQRAQPRRKCDRCISEIEGQNYPVEDWSMGGVRIFGDFRTQEVGSNVEVSMKFKLHDEILKIPHKATIIRKLADGVALQFEPLTKDVRTNFQKVIDDYNIREFAGSLG